MTALSTQTEPPLIDSAWLARARAFQRRRLRLMLVGLLLAPVLPWLYASLSWSAALRGALEKTGITSPWLLVAGCTVAAFLLRRLALLPLDERRLALRRAYGLTREPLRRWLRRQ